MTQATVTMTRPPAGAPEGHDAAMVQRFDAGAAAAAAGTQYVAPDASAATPPATPAEPAAATPATPAASPASEPTPAPDTATEGFIDGILKDTGLTRDSLTAEFVAGGLSEASYTKLASKGIDKATVDQFLGGVKAQVDVSAAAYEAEVKAAAGSPEKYTELVTWAAGALSAEEVETFNQAVNSGNAKLAAFAVSGLNARFQVANPAEPSLINQGQATSGASGFESWAQVTAEMRKPEYAKDPAFRAKVTERLRNSPSLS